MSELELLVIYMEVLKFTEQKSRSLWKEHPSLFKDILLEIRRSSEDLAWQKFQMTTAHSKINKF